MSPGLQPDSFRILHVSDPHFGEKSYYGDVTQHLELILEIGQSLRDAKLIDKNGTKPYFQAAILSGDFTWQGRPDGFRAAAKFIDLLTTMRYCAAGTILLIPGNHDMSFVRDGVTQWTAPAVERHYRDFFADTMGETPDPLLCDVRDFADHGIVLVGLNSSRIIREDTNELGYVGYDQLFAVMNRIWAVRSAAPRPPELLLVALHHHLTHMDTVSPAEVIPGRPRRRYSCDVDAPIIVQGMRNVNVQMVLHGHQHLRWLERHQAGDPVSGLPQPLFISAAASAGICYPDSREEHHFQVIEIFKGLAGLRLHHLYADARADFRTRRWSYHAHDPLPLNPGVLARPGRERWAEMDAHSREWNWFYSREEDSWEARELRAGAPGAWDRLQSRLLAYWVDGSARKALPPAFAERAVFERTLRLTLSALRRDLVWLADFENQLSTPNALSLSQYILRLMLDDGLETQ